ncbi:hypothetical protein [Accumulibacter sp.]|uniref:hypothetical protein n=1 Tax=Accumulibacter sp. TaxID=2053492 RepID=UPI0025CCDB05|nr:hypothetical protein [Accumulibacter sp.]MCM8596829.1 hypothetical protein [Accumulibacter sp.]MCM8624637.1 hypothetical protein [Accumulibacter sp.]MDS4050977.1 hypothetical protein [Accumulibacter sp.]
MPIEVTVGLTVSRSEGDLDLDDFIPLRVGAITLGNGQQFTEPPARILGRGVVHGVIITHSPAIVQLAAHSRCAAAGSATPGAG